MVELDKGDVYLQLGSDHARILAQIKSAQSGEAPYPPIEGRLVTPQQAHIEGGRLKAELDVLQAPYVTKKAEVYKAFADAKTTKIIPL